MKNLIGKLLILAGVGFALVSAVIGLSFSWVFLSGFIGTGGNEAGGELAMMLALTVGAFLFGCVIAKWGKHILAQNDQ